jgi:two-component system cell cycle response regulator DivK
MADVLMIEDDVDSRAILASLISFLNLQFDSAENAAQAIALLQNPSATYRLILSDLALPGSIDGLELIRLIRADVRFQTIPCIAITAFDSQHLRTQALQAGFTAYYLKPINPATFVDDLKRYLQINSPL